MDATPTSTVVGTTVLAPKQAPAATSTAPLNKPLTTGEIQYEIIKVRKPDGTIIKVRRPIAAKAQSNGSSKIVPTAISGGTPRNDVATKPSPSVSLTDNATATAQIKQATPPASAPRLPASKEQRTPQPHSPSQPTHQTPENKTETVASTPVATSSVPAKTAAAAPPPSGADVKHETAPVSTHVPSVHPVGKSSRFGGLKMAGARLALAFAPSIPMDIGDLEAGDISMSDDDDDMDMSDDEHYDSDHGDLDHNDREYEDSNDRNDDQQDHNTSNNNRSVEHNSSASQHNTNSTHNEKAFETALKSTARGLVVPPRPRQTASAEKRTPIADGKEPAIMDEKRDKGPIVSEKEVPASSIEPATPASSKARNLARRSAEWSRYVIWALMILFPVLFIILAIMTALLNGKYTYDPTYSAIGNTVKQCLIVGTTLWPIVFAAVIAQSLRAFATWKVERGVKLMTLEQLVNSNSVAAAVKQPFLLRRIDLVTIGLLLGWGFSPLASQAMQRILSTGGSVPNVPFTWAYIDSTGSDNLFSNGTSTNITTAPDFPVLNRLFNAMFLPMKNPTLFTIQNDIFGQPQMPSYASIVKYNMTEGHLVVDSDGFSILPTGGRHPYFTYTSYYGAPLEESSSGMPASFSDISGYYFASATSSFVLQMSVLEVVDCQPLVEKTWQALQADLPDVDFVRSASQSLYMDVQTYNSTSPGTIYFASAITSYQNLTDPAYNSTCAYTSCSLKQAFYDVGLSCSTASCQAVRMRPSPKPAAVTPLMNTFAGAFVSSIDYYENDTNTMVEGYLGSTFDAFNSSTNSQMNLTGTDNVAFADSLAYLLNTYWTLGFDTKDRYGFQRGASVGGTTALGSGTMLGLYDNYVVSWGWFAALLLSSCFMLCAAISSVIFDTQSIAPDMLGFVSSVARRNKYVDLPKVDSTMSGAERARLLGEVRVMMQDVKPRADVGRIALGTAHASAKRLQQDRLYQ